MPRKPVAKPKFMQDGLVMDAAGTVGNMLRSHTDDKESTKDMFIPIAIAGSLATFHVLQEMGIITDDLDLTAFREAATRVELRVTEMIEAHNGTSN